MRLSLGGTTYETIKLLLDTEPRQPRLWNSKIDRDLSTICLKCLEKDPKRRYSSALSLAEDLERWLKHEPILARHSGIFIRTKKWVLRNPSSALLAASLVALAAAAGWIISKTEFIRKPLTTGIAVLPFENLSDEKDHAFFADGVQDDILTKLAKIADLKVISRTSVMQYRGKQDVRQIGTALRVSHVLEGTVRRAGNKLHVNAQLVDARTNDDIWAEEYDRDLNDVFAIETEVAQSIANRLRTKVSAREKAAMQERPTKDLAAYDLYVRATSAIEQAGMNGLEGSLESKHNTLLRCIDLLNQAVSRDPRFVLAYCSLARAHDTLYFAGVDHSSSRLDLANEAIQSALDLRPDSGDAHLALALHLYWGYFDYERARAELAVAQRSLPNNSRVFELSGLIDRRQGHWSEAVRNLERAAELDPQDVVPLDLLAGTYGMLRDYSRASEAMDRIAALQPNDIPTKLARAWIEVSRRADIRPLQATIERVLADDPAQAETHAVKGCRFFLAIRRRDLDEAGRIAETLPVKNSFNDDFEHGRSFYLGLVARMKGDATAANAAFTAARAQEEAEARARPNFGTILSGLGLVDAGLGRNEEALHEGRRALEITTTAKDALTAGEAITNLALIYAWTGERDLALEQLELAAKIPAGPSYGDLRLSPNWDSLRDDPRFEKIVASLAPK